VINIAERRGALDPTRLAAGLMAALSMSVAIAQGTPPNVGVEVQRVSEHTWFIPGFPNIGIVVGSKAVLVVDTGLGPRNGAAAYRLAHELAPGHKVYLSTTHFHPEHAAGDAGFPKDTILIRNSVQQHEMDDHGREFIKLFSDRSPEQKALLDDVSLRKPDIVFDKDYRVDLGGGVIAQLMWLGGAHTKGDELVLVEPDRTLISGDVVQNKVVPYIPAGGGTPSSWIEVLRQLQSKRVAHVIPDHSAPGGGTLIELDLKFMTELQLRTLELKSSGVSAEAAGEQLTTEFKQRYTDWPITSVAGFVNSIYSEQS
jgi:glyoxylase-like metal-dependent hydrolase (beta-lactamase superfamily II)